MTLAFIGCKSVGNTSNLSLSGNLLEAEQMLAAGELFQAKKITQDYLKLNPKDGDAQRLMALILDEEIAQHKEVFSSESVEDLTAHEKKAEVKTWLERSRSFLSIGEYDQAAMAAENVFTYDPENREASQLLDSIKSKAWEDGKQEIMSGQALARAEAQDRIVVYRRQAEEWMREGKTGAARLAVEKILILSPDDEDALELLEKIQKRDNQSSPV